MNWASVFRRNERFSAYDYVYEGDEPVRIILATLAGEKKHLLRTPEATYIIHDILKEYFYENLGKESLKYHRKAAEYYLLDKKPENLIEALYHLSRAGEYKKSVHIVVRYSEEFTSFVFI